jgi:hypothetical protein
MRRPKREINSIKFHLAQQGIKYVYISHDCDEMKPISIQDLCSLAFDIKTDNHYADYLNYVLERATECINQTGTRLDKINFRIHENGAVYPFGEGGHPYCINFYTRVNVNDLPDFKIE